MAFNWTEPKPARTSPTPEFQFMIYNVSKPKNVGNMMRSAVAFGCDTVVVVGSRKMQNFGAQNADQFLKLVHYETLELAKNDLHARGFEIVGVEIGKDCKSILSPNPYNKPTCFVFGEEGHGMSPTARSACDRFVYIPQYGAGTASLNVSNCASIIFHSFAVWAGYQATPIDGEKFVVDQNQNLTKPKFGADGEVVLSEDQLKKREERQLKKQRLLEEQAQNTTDVDGNVVTSDQEVSLNDPKMQDTTQPAETAQVDNGVPPADVVPSTEAPAEVMN